MIYLADSNPKFVEGIKTVENNIARAKKVGEYKQVPVSSIYSTNSEWRWFPGKSPEGGLPTLAWGHKITPKEWSEKKIHFVINGQQESKDFRYGLTDEEVNAVLRADLFDAEESAQRDWDNYHGKRMNRLWESLPDKYKGAMVNLVFNSGPLAKKGAWIWNTVARGIEANDDKKVVQGMVTSYKKPNGERVSLTTRAKEIGKALGLPWQTLGK